MNSNQNFPGGITGILIKKFIPAYQDIQNEEVRARYGFLGGWVSVLVNLLLAGIKFVIGILISSSSLIADAIHSLSDLLSSAVIIWGFNLSRKPDDQEHPFGYAKAELIASLVVAILLIIAGFELLQNNIKIIYYAEFSTVSFNWWMLAAVAATILVKEWLGRFAMRLAKCIESKALEADSWHHYLDALTTVLVIIGITASHFGHIWVDNAVGILVSLVVIWSGIEIGKDTISPLLGENVDRKVITELKQIALSNLAVHEIHDIIVHKYGFRYFISMHAVALDQYSAIQLHDIAADITTKVKARFNGDCIVHMDPIDYECPRYQEVHSILTKLIKAKEELIDFHDLNFRYHEEQEIINCEISVNPKLDKSVYPKLKSEISFYLGEICPDSKLNVILEPGYNIIRKRETD